MNVLELIGRSEMGFLFLAKLATRKEQSDGLHRTRKEGSRSQNAIGKIILRSAKRL